MNRELNLTDIAVKAITDAVVKEIQHSSYFPQQIARELVKQNSMLITDVANSLDVKAVSQETAKFVLKELEKKDIWSKRSYSTEAVVADTKKELAKLLAQREYEKIVKETNDERE